MDTITQVYENGEWRGFFLTPTVAKAWVRRQPNPADFEVTDRRPERVDRLTGEITDVNTTPATT